MRAATLFVGHLCIAAGLSGGLARAQGAALAAGPLTLAGAIAEARQNRAILEGDKDRVGAARARVKQARAPLLPRIDFQASATDGPLGAPALGLGGLVGTPLKKHTGASLNLVQTLLDFGRAQDTVRARRQEVAASSEALQADTNRVALDVAQAYLQVLQARRLLEVNRQILEQRQLVARQAAALQQNGLSSRVDVDLAELSVNQAQLAIVRSQNDLLVAYSSLSTSMGRTVLPDTPLVDMAGTGSIAKPGAPSANGAAGASGLPPAASPTTALSLETAEADAMRDRPELRQAEAQIRGLDYLASAARAGGLPVLTAVGSIGRVNPVPLFKSSDKPWAVGIAVSVPVFTGGLVEGQVQESRLNAASAKANLVELTNVVRQQVISALANLSAAEESLVVARSQVIRAQDVLSLATERYQARLGSIVEAGQAQVAYATAQNDLVRAQYDRELARAALAFATGRIYSDDESGGRTIR